MGIGRLAGAVLATSMLVAQPAAATDVFRIPAASNPRPAAFGGFTVRLPIGRQAAAKPEARVQLTSYSMDLAQPARMRIYNRAGLELGMSKSGKPLMFASGQNTAEFKQKLGLSTGTTLLIVGGIAVAVVVIALAAGGAGMGDTCPEYEGSRDHCINP